VLDNGRMLGMNERQTDTGTCTGRRRCRGCSPRCTPPSASPWSVRWSVNIWDRRPASAYLIQQAEGVFDVGAVFAGMFVLSAFVILIDIA